MRRKVTSLFLIAIFSFGTPMVFQGSSSIEAKPFIGKEKKNFGAYTDNLDTYWEYNCYQQYICWVAVGDADCKWEETLSIPKVD